MPPLLPTVNAMLNLAAFGLLVGGRAAILRKDVETHRRFMVAAFATSCLFLVLYLVHHARVGSVRFEGEGPLRSLYLAILLTHTVLAALVPPLAARTLFLAWRQRAIEHQALARMTWPIWIYVSVTGVVIYLLLYVRPLIA